MNFNFESAIGIFISGFYAIFLVLFIYESTRKSRSAPYLIHLLICGFIGSLFSILDGFELLPPLLPNIRVFLIMELAFYGLQFFFFYLFLEEISSIRPKSWKILLTFSFLILQQTSLGLILWFSTFSSKAVECLWFLADIGYNNLALLVFAIFGISIYFKHYKYTKEKKAILFIAGLFLITLGYIVYSLVDYIGFFSILPEWLETLSPFSEVFPMLGLMIILLIYIYDVDYIYRLPNDHYRLIVTYKSGITIHTVEFKTKKTLPIKDNLFSGFMTSISYIFDNVLRSQAPIESISSKDATILMRSGKKIIVIMLARQPTRILERAMDRYITIFEKKFERELDLESTEITRFKEADELIKPIFPFLKIENSENT